ncbi:Hypothetical Protein FCC1311_095282 [Hondaea fermentalgiana]|uniref:Uncharacterized protein n=1 Tax=Hondaea fermentalgiana TaxID=2315210 RepID=A0A2R5GZ56_9STRA|nr:Hypothetical Protein FCC1311_095282 [Hondaea fermentalgiana]|eukprot:GBG33304.1 Hypothetical Protein FCC1311_095282 [Hondaea fermentalgiana]
MQREDAPRALEELERAYHDGLVGWPVVVAGVSGVVVDHERGAPFVRFKTDSDEVKRHRPHQVLPALVAWQREHGEVAKGKVVPEGVVKLATMLFTLAQQLKSMKDAVKAWRKKRAAKREALLAKRRDTTNDIGDHDTQLKSFDAQAAYWDNAEKLEEEFAKSLEAHELCNVLSPFMSLTSVENYFKDKFNMPITRQSIKRRLSGPVGERVGGRPFLSNAQEEDLAKHVSQMAKRVHENNPTIAIGDVRNEELTLPLGDTSLYKYIQNYEYGNNVPAARAVAQSDNPPVEDDMVQTMMVGSRKGASGTTVRRSDVFYRTQLQTHLIILMAQSAPGKR